MIDTSQVIFKIADESDLEILVDMRLKFALEIQKHESNAGLDEIKKKTSIYFNDHFKNSSYIGLLGCYKQEAICCAGLLIYDLPPLIGKVKRTQGHVLNFYTIPKYRKRGVGTALLNFMIIKSKEKGINRLFLNAIKEGESLYYRCGFKESEEKAMVLNL